MSTKSNGHKITVEKHAVVATRDPLDNPYLIFFPRLSKWLFLRAAMSNPPSIDSEGAFEIGLTFSLENYGMGYSFSSAKAARSILTKFRDSANEHKNEKALVVKHTGTQTTMKIVARNS